MTLVRLTVCLVCTLAVTLVGAAKARAECQSELVSFLLSPDNAWAALVQEELCTGDGPASAGVTDTVQIVERGQEPTHLNDVFGVEEHGRPENRPLIRWLAARKLQITVPNLSLIGLQKSRYAGVEISIKFEPDDPVARDRWLTDLGLKPK
jgi:hypothetical protein